MDEYLIVQEYLLLNLPLLEDNPLSYLWLRDAQDAIQTLKQQCEDPTTGFHTCTFNETELICYAKSGKDEEDLETFGGDDL